MLAQSIAPGTFWSEREVKAEVKATAKSFQNPDRARAIMSEVKSEVKSVQSPEIERDRTFVGSYTGPKRWREGSWHNPTGPSTRAAPLPP